jgi:hypothetical protein
MFRDGGSLLVVLVLFQEVMLKHAGKYKDWFMLILDSLPCGSSQAASISVFFNQIMLNLGDTDAVSVTG